MNTVKSSDNSTTRKMIRSSVGVVVIAVIIFLLLAMDICSRFGIKGNWERIDLANDTDVTYLISRSDGSTDKYNQPYFANLHMGDTLTITIPPQGITAFDKAELVFTLYHCQVTVINGTRLIYAEDFSDRSELIGRRNYVIPLYDDYMNYPIVITARVMEKDTVNKIENFQIIPDTIATYALMADKTHSLVLYTAFIVGDLLAFSIAIVDSVRKRHVSMLLSISLYGISIVEWIMGYNGIYPAFISDQRISSLLEYMMLFLAPAPLAFFMKKLIQRKPWHTLCSVMAVVFTADFLIASVCQFLIPGITYIDLVAYHRPLFLTGLIIFLLSLIFEQKFRSDIALKVIDIGFLAAAVFSILDILRFYLEAWMGDQYILLHRSVSPISILIMLFTLLIYYCITSAESSLWKLEQENLRRLAYIDQMTGVPNRSYCYKQISALEKSGRQDFVMIFVDINFLKLTNDTWGHDKGDELIRTVGTLLSHYFSDDGFFGRWGGDEFIACHYGSLDETETLMKKLTDEMEQMNQEGRFDFRMSISYGCGASTPEEPLLPEAAINRADEAMYVYKQKAHAERQ